jgi:hypothetical protein
VLARHGNIALMGLKGNPVRFIRRSPGGHPPVTRLRAGGRL